MINPKTMNSNLSLRRRLGLEIARKITNTLVEQHPLKQLFWECTLRCNLHCRLCGSDCKIFFGVRIIKRCIPIRIMFLW